MGETPVEPIHEIHLTDDLADSLVNPPTDREVFGEEENKLSFLMNSQIASHNEESKEMSIESKNSTEIKVELVNEIIETEIEDKEICEITENIEQMESPEFMKHTSKNKYELEVKNKETEEPEFIQNIIETVDVVKVSENTGEKQNIDADNNVKTECVLSEPECEAGKSKQLETFKNKAQDTKPPNKQIKTSKKGKKINLKSEKGFSKSEDQKWPQNQESPAESKMSYSSVIKSNLIKEPKPTPPTTSHPKVDPVPIPSPLPTGSNSSSSSSSSSSSASQAAKISTHQDYDKWEKVPPSVSKP